MKRKVIFFVLCLNVFFCFGTEKLKKNNSNISVTFYYNPMTFYFGTRNEMDVMNGDYKIKKVFSYKEIEKISSIDSVLEEQPVYVFIDTMEKALLESVKRGSIDCVCEIKKEDGRILRFTYDELENSSFMFYNERLIKFNEVYGNFAKAIIQYLLGTESDTME